MVRGGQEERGRDRESALVSDPRGPLAFIILPTTIESSHQGRMHGESCTCTRNNTGVVKEYHIGTVMG